ncbi:type II secretion system protein [Wenzhouxiangella sp. EGI_FJ10409]|uniref:type II secretion system protein n=1 Tax=Wenzhouxiangella sp. EGI_FJ10409 TaxID=3243767 RepID=UPI0035E3BB84
MRAKSRGFTLIELILVIVLVGILSAVATVFILPPFQAAADIERRAMLVDAADLAINRITREVRNALPNSLAVSGNRIDFISTVTHGRYRRLPGGGNNDIFVPARSSDSFDVLGGLIDSGAVETRSPGTDCGASTGHCLSIYNTGQPGFDAWSGENIAAILNAGTNSIEYDNGGSGPAFATHSPQQRFHVISETVSYICANGELRRHAGYGLSGDPDDVTGRLVADSISSCQFTYNSGTSARRGLLTVRLDLADEGESVFLLGQAQVLNTP